MGIAKIFAIGKEFKLCGEILAVEENFVGHINNTFFVTCKSDDEKGTRRYVIQRVNTSIFKKPDEVMSNIENVTKHIRAFYEKQGIEASRRTLTVIRTNDDKLGYVDPNGNYWRAYDFIEEATCYLKVESADMFTKVGKAFGEFQMQLSDFDASLLYETIPNFHNTEDRFHNLEIAIEQNLSGRRDTCEADIAFALARKPITSFINDGIKSGKFSLRVTHNDTKLNNIMVDDKTGEGVCVIDLDTVMPGSVLCDFGDSIRFGASSAKEDEKNPDNVFVRLDMFDAFAKGFIGGLDGSLSEDEIKALPMGAMIITYETGIRFLTDYLNGDTYFRTEYATHNLDRARNQFALVADMEKKMPEMEKLISKYI